MSTGGTFGCNIVFACEKGRGRKSVAYFWIGKVRLHVPIVVVFDIFAAAAITRRLTRR